MKVYSFDPIESSAMDALTATHSAQAGLAHKAIADSVLSGGRLCWCRLSEDNPEVQRLRDRGYVVAFNCGPATLIAW